MKRFLVDLSGYSHEEFDRLETQLDGTSEFCFLCANYPGCLDVTWQHDESIEEFLGIPQDRIKEIPLFQKI